MSVQKFLLCIVGPEDLGEQVAEHFARSKRDSVKWAFAHSVSPEETEATSHTIVYGLNSRNELEEAFKLAMSEKRDLILIIVGSEPKPKVAELIETVPPECRIPAPYPHSDIRDRVHVLIDAHTS